MSDEITAVGVPTLVIVGTDDTAIPPREARGIAEHIPGARLEQVPNCGHSSTLEQSDKITELLCEFLSHNS